MTIVSVTPKLSLRIVRILDDMKRRNDARFETWESRYNELVKVSSITKSATNFHLAIRRVMQDVRVEDYDYLECLEVIMEFARFLQEERSCASLTISGQ